MYGVGKGSSLTFTFSVRETDSKLVYTVNCPGNRQQVGQQACL